MSLRKSSFDNLHNTDSNPNENLEKNTSIKRGSHGENIEINDTTLQDYKKSIENLSVWDFELVSLIVDEIKKNKNVGRESILKEVGINQRLFERIIKKNKLPSFTMFKKNETLRALVIAEKTNREEVVIEIRNNAREKILALDIAVFQNFVKLFNAAKNRTNKNTNIGWNFSKVDDFFNNHFTFDNFSIRYEDLKLKRPFRDYIAEVIKERKHKLVSAPLDSDTKNKKVSGEMESLAHNKNESQSASRSTSTQQRPPASWHSSTRQPPASLATQKHTLFSPPITQQGINMEPNKVTELFEKDSSSSPNQSDDGITDEEIKKLGLKRKEPKEHKKSPAAKKRKIGSDHNSESESEHDSDFDYRDEEESDHYSSEKSSSNDDTKGIATTNINPEKPRVKLTFTCSSLKQANQEKKLSAAKPGFGGKSPRYLNLKMLSAQSTTTTPTDPNFTSKNYYASSSSQFSHFNPANNATTQPNLPGGKRQDNNNPDNAQNKNEDTANRPTFELNKQ